MCDLKKEFLDIFQSHLFKFGKFSKKTKIHLSKQLVRAEFHQLK